MKRTIILLGLLAVTAIVSCQKSDVDTVMHIKTATSQPYTGVYTGSGKEFVFFIVYKTISSDSVMHYYSVYTDPITNNVFDNTDNTLYYNPTELSLKVMFDPASKQDQNGFIQMVNQKIATPTGYALVQEENTDPFYMRVLP